MRWGITGRSSRDGERGNRVVHAGTATARLRGSLEQAVLELEGELDFTCAEQIIEQVSMIEHRVTVIDLGLLEFLDSAGVHAIRSIQQAAADRGVDIPILVGVKPEVRRTIEVVESVRSNSTAKPRQTV